MPIHEVLTQIEGYRRRLLHQQTLIEYGAALTGRYWAGGSAPTAPITRGA